jgi:DNA polymerase-3 subunit epsilon
VIIVLDTETTGTEDDDQIVELCIRLGIEAEAECRTWRFKPTVPIHPEAQATHGITAEALEQCGAFVDSAAEIVDLIERALVIVGFNLRFDLNMLQAEVARAGLPMLYLTRKKLVDAMRLWQHFEPRTLAAAHEKFIGTPIVGAHAACGDASATAAVLLAMVDRFVPELAIPGDGWDALAALSDPLPERHTWCGPSHHLVWKGDVIVFGFGKYKGSRVDETDPMFLRWVQGKNFPKHVKTICRRAAEATPAAFAEWIAKFPRAKP